MDEHQLEARVREFFAQWGVSFDALCQSFRDMTTDDLLHEHASFTSTTTRDTAIRFFERSREALGTDTVEVEFKHIAVRGNVVFSERVDYVRRADGSQIFQCPVVGVMEFEGDRIARWGEYFDPTGLLPKDQGPRESRT